MGCVGSWRASLTVTSLLPLHYSSAFASLKGLVLCAGGAVGISVLYRLAAAPYTLTTTAAATAAVVATVFVCATAARVGGHYCSMYIFLHTTIVRYTTTTITSGGSSTCFLAAAVFSMNCTVKLSK